MKTITNLTPAARADLIAWCAANLKPEFDPVLYADGFIAELPSDEDFAHFEIRGLHARTGNPVTTTYGEGEIVWTEFDEEGEVLA